jgi:membrane-bound lytic murein transglycosylase D
MLHRHKSPALVLAGLLAYATVSTASELPNSPKSQPSSSNFSLYNEALSAEADRVLNATTRPAPQASDKEATNELRRMGSEIEESRVRWFAQRYWKGRQENLTRALTRLQRLRPLLEPILEGEGVPAALVAVVLVESAGRSTAQSPRDARGLWQLVPATARHYGLRVAPGIDERLDIEKSTRAAARYFRDLYFRFGDWSLALAAYNAGEEAVQKAVDRSGVKDLHKLGAKNLLPMETRNYVPAVLAAADLLGSVRTLNGRAESAESPRQIKIVFAQLTGEKLSRGESGGEGVSVVGASTVTQGR